MISCSPQRYLANNRNALRLATLTPSSVQPVEDSVLAIPTPRQGTAQVALSGSYSGAEEATYDVEIVDAGTDTNLISAPIFTGAGSGKLDNVIATGTPQDYAVELADAGTPERSAFVDFEGVKIVARIPGASGNTIRLLIDQSGIDFTPTTFSLLEDLPAGSGSDSNGLKGAAFDWDTAPIGSDNQIPATAHRISFGDDTSLIYLAYKRFTGTEWTYHFVPETKRSVAKGTIVNFVTGGRDVTVTDGGSPPEEFLDLVTVFDLLNALKLGSLLVDIAGVVANDRSPTGQAARELTLRTDAHVEPSYGTGSKAATGFVDTFAGAGAGTELVTATCFAVTGRDNPNAHLGAELWKVKGSLAGDAGEAVTGVPFSVAGSPSDWGFTIPQRLPDGYGDPHGVFSEISIDYVGRPPNVTPPPICPVALELGPDASDQQITLTYTKRPSGNCLCKGMPVPNLRTRCLGIFDEGGPDMGYSGPTITRLIDLYDWQADTVRAHSAYRASGGAEAGKNTEDPMIAGTVPVQPTLSYDTVVSGAEGGGFSVTQQVNTYLSSVVQEGLEALVSHFEESLAAIDALPAGALQTDGFDAWDTALAELKGDVAAGSTILTQTVVFPSYENLVAGNAVCTFLANDGSTQVRKAIPGGIQYGFVIANVTAPANATVFFWGVAAAAPPGSFTVGANYQASSTTPGNWVISTNVATMAASAVGVASSATEITVANPTPAQAAGSAATLWGLLADRYETRLLWVGISAGIPQVGKSDADSVTSGDGCWRDWGDPFYWEVVGSDKGKYAPAFNNHPYYSSRLAKDGKAYYSTHEFAFQINVKCPSGLLEGDRIILSIGDAGFPGTYQIGDQLFLPVISAQPFYLAGGQDGDDLQKWFVSASVDGPLAPFNYNLSDPSPHSYVGAGLTFDISNGGIPFEKGDRFTFGVEHAHYHWRKNGGSYSATLPVPLALTAFDSGLSIQFTTGAAPSFVAGDMFKFRALQPWAVSNVQSPRPERWQWTGDAPTLVADLGSALTLDMAAIALHTLPAGATIVIEGGTSPGVYTWTETLTRRPGVIFGPFTTPRVARYVRLTLTGVTDAGIGWWWIGEGLTTELSASLDSLRRSYKIVRQSAGLRNVGKFIGKSLSGDIEWTEGALNEDDAAAISEMVDWVKANDDEPIIVVPQVTRPDEVIIAQVITDDFDMDDISDYNRDIAFPRRFSAKLPLAGVW